MKRMMLTLILVLAIIPALPQQIATSSFSEMQGLLHNPSVAGVQQQGMVGAAFRTMWEGFPGSPRTTLVFGSGYLKKIKVGLGGVLYNDETGPTRRTGLQMAYAYHIPLADDAEFSIGLEGRFQQFSLDKNKLQQTLGNDPVLGSTDTRFRGDAGLGICFTGKKFQAGISVSQLIQSRLDFYTGNLSQTEEGRYYRHFYLHSRYQWVSDASTNIIPHLLFIFLPGSPLEFQGGVRVEHMQTFWWGVSLRAHQSWMLSAGLKIRKKFSIGYSFDIYKTPLSIYDNGSSAHEFLVQYNFLQ